MNIRNIQFYITYAFLFACVFFVGFDNLILFNKVFPHLNISTTSLFSFLGVSLGGVVIGLLLFRRLIKKQSLDFVLKISLLSSAFFSWLQFYLPSVLDLSSLHTQTITVFLTNISMGIFLYCSQVILKEKKQGTKNLTTFLLWVFFILGFMVLSFNLMSNKGDGTSILSSITYTLGFVSAMTLRGNDFMEIKHSNPYSHLGILIGIIYLTICYFTFDSAVMEYLRKVFNYQLFFIFFALLFFWFRPSISKASVVLFLVVAQFLN